MYSVPHFPEKKRGRNLNSNHSQIKDRRHQLNGNFPNTRNKELHSKVFEILHVDLLVDKD